MGNSQKKYHLIALGTDGHVLNPRSFLQEKVLAYGKDFASAHILCPAISGYTEIERYDTITFYPILGSRALFTFRAFFAGRKVIRANPGPWIVSSDNPFELGLVSWILAKLSGASLYLQIHTDFLSPYFRRGSWKERIRYMLALFLVPRARCLRVVSVRVKNSISRNFGIPENNIQVFPIQTEIAAFLKNHKPTEPIFRSDHSSLRMVSVGRFMDKEKNFSMLIKIMPDVLKEVPRALLTLVGNGPDESYYRALIQARQLEKYVIIEPWRDDLPHFLRQFNLFVLPSNYEGWGRVIIEAMAAELPIVMTDVGVAGEVVKNGISGTVVPVADARAITDAIVAIHRNPDIAKKFIAAGLEIIAKLGSQTNSDYLLKYRKSLRLCIEQ